MQGPAGSSRGPATAHRVEVAGTISSDFTAKTYGPEAYYQKPFIESKGGLPHHTLSCFPGLYRGLSNWVYKSLVYYRILSGTPPTYGIRTLATSATLQL